MRSSLTQCALVVLPIFVLAGCRSTESGWHMPRSSLSSLNPFSSSSDDETYAPKPSSLATPASTSPSGAGYVASTPDATGQTGYNTAGSYNPSSGTYPSTRYPYSTATANSLAGSTGRTSSAAGASPAVTPQTGYYDSRAGYEATRASGTAASGYSPSGSNYSWNTGTGSYRSPGSSASPSAGSGYGSVGAAGSYGDSAATPRYGTVSDRYGLNRSGSGLSDAPSTGQNASTDPYRTVPNYNPQTATPQGLAPRYDGAAASGYGASLDSRYQGNADSASLSTADARYSASGYRYPSDSSRDALSGSGAADAGRSDAAASGYNSYRNGQFGYSSGGTNWNPGDTGYTPGQTNYQPGNTGYNPPGISPYRSPATSSSPFLPGSTKLYEPRDGTGPDTSEGSDSSASPGTDSRVIPAGHMRL